MVELKEYMSNSIRRIMGRAYSNMLSAPREAHFAFRMKRLFEHSEKRRQAVAEKEGVEVPPFLISSVSTTCNLDCKGCYARKNGIASKSGKQARKTLTPAQWRSIFEEAATLGVNFSLIAGGEPLMRRDLLESIAEVKDMIFPVFTNGTLMKEEMLSFFDKNLNMVPVISIEGQKTETDERRGSGVYANATTAMKSLSTHGLFFGTSITVTTENLEYVTSREFLDQLHEMGCKLVFYVEYVPIEEKTEHLALKDEHVERMERILEKRRSEYERIIFLSFPGDEKALGGCLASGRGFFHIGPDGSAEPCPFSPYSDSNVAQLGLLASLKSPLFKALRDMRDSGWSHTGGCTLYEHREEVENIIKQQKRDENSNQIS